MSIDAIRFRQEGALVVLQVLEREEDRDGGMFGYCPSASWRDARVEDLLHVARYTRAYDALDQNISSLQSSVLQFQSQVNDVLEKHGMS